METAREQGAHSLISRNRVGALLRVFASDETAAEYHIGSVLDAVHRLTKLTINDKRIYSRIDILVSSDPEFEDSDYGGTAERLKSIMRLEFPQEPVHVYEIKRGDIYCMLLNYGITNQLEDRVAYSHILSHTVQNYVTYENIVSLLAALHQKARVAGIAIDELSERILNGRIANTCAIWHNKSLMTVGGFDLRAAKPTRFDVESKTVSGTATLEGGNEVTYSYKLAGAEEIIPLIRFYRFFGKCIAPISPHENTEKIWTPPKKEWDPKGYARHHAKMATKDVRQEYMAGLVNADIAVLKDACMKLDI